MPKYFGTDGIRGVANADLSAELALDVGRAVALACREGVLGTGPRERPRVVVGRDTRPSGDMLESAVVAGLSSAGADVLRGGILPTAAVAFLVAELDAEAGIVLSASHNPAPDNGIKVFGPQGWKLSEHIEEAIERLMTKPASRPTSARVGRVVELLDSEERYVAHLAGCVSTDLSGLKVIVDCAHGAAYRVAPRVLAKLGAEVVALHATGEGEKINQECGATHPRALAAVSRREGAMGLTFDGDADRVLAADEDGRIVDGDAIVAMIAARLRDRGELTGDAIVVTVMANQALRAWCNEERIKLVETPVGDRYVLEALREQGLVLGGEQSGHVIRLDRSTTGDGILTGLGLLEVVASSGGRLAAAVPFRAFPQVIVNVPTGTRERLRSSERVRTAVEDAERRLGSEGRVLVRSSGTEPFVRVMVEAASEDAASDVARSIAAVVDAELNAGA